MVYRFVHDLRAHARRDEPSDNILIILFALFLYLYIFILYSMHNVLTAENVFGLTDFTICQRCISIKECVCFVHFARAFTNKASKYRLYNLGRGQHIIIRSSCVKTNF